MTARPEAGTVGPEQLRYVAELETEISKLQQDIDRWRTESMRLEECLNQEVALSTHLGANLKQETGKREELAAAALAMLSAEGEPALSEAAEQLRAAHSRVQAAPEPTLLLDFGLCVQLDDLPDSPRDAAAYAAALASSASPPPAAGTTIAERGPKQVADAAGLSLAAVPATSATSSGTSHGRGSGGGQAAAAPTTQQEEQEAPSASAGGAAGSSSSGGGSTHCSDAGSNITQAFASGRCNGTKPAGSGSGSGSGSSSGESSSDDAPFENGSPRSLLSLFSGRRGVEEACNSTGHRSPPPSLLPRSTPPSGKSGGGQQPLGGANDSGDELEAAFPGATTSRSLIGGSSQTGAAASGRSLWGMATAGMRLGRGATPDAPNPGSGCVDAARGLEKAGATPGCGSMEQFLLGQKSLQKCIIHDQGSVLLLLQFKTASVPAYLALTGVADMSTLVTPGSGIFNTRLMSNMGMLASSLQDASEMLRVRIFCYIMLFLGQEAAAGRVACGKLQHFGCCRIQLTAEQPVDQAPRVVLSVAGGQGANNPGGIQAAFELPTTGCAGEHHIGYLAKHSHTVSADRRSEYGRCRQRSTWPVDQQNAGAITEQQAESLAFLEDVFWTGQHCKHLFSKLCDGQAVLSVVKELASGFAHLRDGLSSGKQQQARAGAKRAAGAVRLAVKLLAGMPFAADQAAAACMRGLLGDP